MDLDLHVVPNLTFRSCLVAATDVVCFDVDNIVCMDEDIALSGLQVPFPEVLAARLDLFKPSSSTVLRSDPQASFWHKGIGGYLISGGFCQMINAVIAVGVFLQGLGDEYYKVCDMNTYIYIRGGDGFIDGLRDIRICHWLLTITTAAR
ncbi:putative phosphoserine phosphatase [Helianthus annuus]|nr:putative phosphoserine phosphatase [Helianthus annuus]